MSDHKQRRGEGTIVGGALPRLLVAGVVAASITAVCRPANGYTSSDPKVKEAVERAVGFLEKGGKGDSRESRPGGQAVVGIALLKSGTGPSHPKIVAVANFVQRATNRGKTPGDGGLDVYGTALAAIFFCLLDPNRYGRDIDTLLRHLESIQKDHGGWGYPNLTTGDTSMTQNVVLAFWEAKKSKLRISADAADRGLIWLLKTQDPSGAFGYQGNVSRDFTPVQQGGIRPSMAGAGLGSIYVCADLLNVGKTPKRDNDGKPPALREIKKREPPPRSRVNPQLVQQAVARGKVWMDKNFEIEHTGHRYPLYNLYTVERYHTFREKAEGKAEAEPAWYNEGVRYLLEKQAADGSWTGSSGAGVSTAFGVLFLIRSTKISLAPRSFGDGTLVGGRGLPKNTAGLTVHRGNVVAKPELGALDKLLAAMEDSAGPDSAEALQALAVLPSDEAADLVSKHVKALQKLVSDASPETRLAAVEALGRKRNLDHVPALIYALTDPEPDIVRAARDSLRRISRRFQGFGLSNNPDELELHAAIRKWQAWYLAIRPDAELED
ncbi:MAG: HEAT repeat domain-containing protein [Planctomycetes bacterium]|nr:HEAT repeat domain-containing protein [Planctomycetota bacterium]